MTDAPKVKMRVMENDVFHVALTEDWVPQDRPNAQPGQAAFIQDGTGFAFFQSVLSYTDPANADRKAVITEVIGKRVEAFAKDGHSVRTGKVGYTEESWGWIAIADVVLDEAVYGITATYGFPECILNHWITGPAGKEAQIRDALIKIMATVYRREPEAD